MPFVDTWEIPKMFLRFYTQTIKYGTYSQKDVLKELTVSSVYIELKKQYLTTEQNLKCVISTQVSGWWKFRRRWILVLDCDSFSDKEKAVEELRLLSIKYKVFLSSPNKYWIVTNHIGSLRSCINFMQCIPGVDREFVACCEKFERVIIRAFPKAGYRPNLVTNYDTFDGKANLWVNLFKSYWGGSPIVNWLINRQRDVIDLAKKETEAQLALMKAKEEEEEKRKKEEESRNNKPRRNLRII
jgi:hypothetical protein